MNNLSICYISIGKYEESIEWLDKIISLEKDYHLAYYNKGVALDKLGNLVEAI